MIFHTIFVHDPRMWHDFEPGPYFLSSRSQCTCSQHFYLGHNFSVVSRIWLIPLTIIVHNTRVWHSFVPRSKSQCTHSQNLCQGNNLLTANWIWMVVHLFFVNKPRVCHVMTLAYFGGHFTIYCQKVISLNFKVKSLRTPS